MNQDERRFDFHGLGLALKQAREEKGWTQAYVAELVGKTDRTIMNIENKGQHPSFNLFFKLVTLFEISVDQFFYTEGQRGENSCRKHIDVLLAYLDFLRQGQLILRLEDLPQLVLHLLPEINMVLCREICTSFMLRAMLARSLTVPHGKAPPCPFAERAGPLETV